MTMTNIEAYEVLQHKTELLEDLVFLETDAKLRALYEAQLLTAYQQLHTAYNSMTAAEHDFLAKLNDWKEYQS